ncbi:MAG: hypothetical protein JWQ38_3822 [Flavipsychrobacter sp.]|nr:hypothetical protein [Flavipsychrobacter sp.]
MLNKGNIKVATLTILLAGSSLYAVAKDKNDVAKDKLKGKVKSIAITGYKMKSVNDKPEKNGIIFSSSSKYNESGSILEFITSAIEDTLEGEAVKYKAVKSVYHYDKEGTLSAKNDYNPNGTLEDSSFYKVDAKGSRVDWYTYKGNGTLSSHTISEYNLKGDLVELSEYTGDKLKSKTTYVYDGQGNQIAETGFDDKGKVKWREEFKYNTKTGQMNEVYDFDANDAMTGRFTYRYDTRGNMAEETEFYSDTSIRNKKTTTKYDLDGNPREINHFNYNGRLVNQIKVDQMGLHFTEVSYNDDASLQSVISKKYDDKANQVFEDRFYTKDSSRIKIEYKLEYDTHGNWTKNTTSKNGVPVQMTERKIEYYTDPAEKKKKPGTEGK